MNLRASYVFAKNGCSTTSAVLCTVGTGWTSYNRIIGGLYCSNYNGVGFSHRNGIGYRGGCREGGSLFTKNGYRTCSESLMS